MDNREKITGTVVEIYELRQLSAYFRKREFVIRFSDTDFQNKIVERFIKFGLINQDVPLLDNVRIDDTVSVSYYIDGRNIVKDGKTSNFTNLVCYELDVLASVSRDTAKEKNEVIIPGGTTPLKQSTLDELMITPGEEDDPFPVNNKVNDFSGLPF